jgi:hypothetical protein
VVNNTEKREAKVPNSRVFVKEVEKNGVPPVLGSIKEYEHRNPNEKSKIAMKSELPLWKPAWF